VAGMLAIGIVLAMWFAKGAIGSRLRHLTRLQIMLLDWANRRGDWIGHATERLAAFKRYRGVRHPVNHHWME
jgi:hypothetical protein